MSALFANKGAERTVYYISAWPPFRSRDCWLSLLSNPNVRFATRPGSSTAKQKRTLKIDEYATIIGIAGGSFALVNQNVYSKATPDLELSCMVLEISAKTLK